MEIKVNQDSPEGEINPSFTKPKKNITVIILLALLLLAVLVVAYGLNKQKHKTLDLDQEKSKTNSASNFYTKVDNKYLPQGIPNDLPFEKDALILDNYTVKLDNGKFQSTRAYISSQDMEASFKGFNDYLSKNGWQIFSQTDKTDIKGVFSRNQLKEISVIISRNTLNSQVTITVNSIFIENKNQIK